MKQVLLLILLGFQSAMGGFKIVYVSMISADFLVIVPIYPFFVDLFLFVSYFH